VFRVIFYALLFVLMFIDISCSQGRNKHKNASKDVEFVKNEINIDHFLIFKFDSNIEDVIQLLRAQKINYNNPTKINKDGLELKYIKVMNFPIGSGKQISVDLYFSDDSLCQIEHNKSFREKDIYYLASEYNSFMNEIFCGLFEKYGNPTTATNLHFSHPEAKFPTRDLFYPKYDTIAEHITINTWQDWQYLEPGARNDKSTSFSKLEIGWSGKTGGIFILKEFTISFDPFQENIDRSKRPDYLPPLPDEYKDGKIYTFYNEIVESNFIIYANSQKMSELTKRYKEFSKQRDIIKENSTRDSIEKKMNKLINEL